MQETIAVCLVTYNQERFIAQAIESVLMQQTEAHVQLFIGEDCSTDGTRAICERYAAAHPNSIILLRNAENMGLVRNSINVFKKITEYLYSVYNQCDIAKIGGGYVAMLDGDDYWTDPLKLQKQLDKLHSSQRFGLVTSQCATLENGTLHHNTIKKIREGNYLAEDAQWKFINCTVMFRASLLQYIDWTLFKKYDIPQVDYPMYMIFANHTDFGYVPDETAVWRIHHSVSHPETLKKSLKYADDLTQILFLLREAIPEKFNDSDDVIFDQGRFHKFKAAFKFRDYKLAKQLRQEIKYYKVSLKQDLALRNRLLFFAFHIIKTLRQRFGK